MPRETSTAGVTSPAPKKSFMAATKPPSEAHRPGQGQGGHRQGDQGLGADDVQRPAAGQAESVVHHQRDGKQGGELAECEAQQSRHQGGVAPDAVRPRRYSSICFSSFSLASSGRRTRRTRTSRLSTPPVSLLAALGRNMRQSIPAVSAPLTTAPNSRSRPSPPPGWPPDQSGAAPPPRRSR